MSDSATRETARITHQLDHARRALAHAIRRDRADHVESLAREVNFHEAALAAVNGG